MGIVDLLRQIPDIHFQENEKLSLKTSLGVGGEARYYVQPESVNGLIRCANAANVCGVPFKTIGNGTNLLVSDKGYDGLIACTKNLNGLLLDKGEIIALCGTPLLRFVNFVSGSGRTGAEGLAGIPATVGGAICNNAGAFGFCVSDYISEVTLLNQGEIVRLKKVQCGFGYRQSAFSNFGIYEGATVISAKFRFPRRKIRHKSGADYYAIRKLTQPSGRTCGSVFKNPHGGYAGRLIEDAGLKNFRVRGAYVSDVHANFIITEENATATDVYTLIREIKRRVYDKFGVTLKEEVEYLGEF